MKQGYFEPITYGQFNILNTIYYKILMNQIYSILNIMKSIVQRELLQVHKNQKSIN